MYAENLIILLKIVEGWALTCSLESPAARGVRHCSVLLCTSAECGAFGGQGGPGAARAPAERRRFLPAVPLPSAVPRVCRGWRFRALPRSLQPAGVPLHGRRGLHRGGWDAVGAAFSPRSQPKESRRRGRSIQA